MERPVERTPIRALVRYYLRLGLLGFGGPVALVGQMEREMVGERKWLSKEEMREGIAVCQSLPGPLAIRGLVDRARGAGKSRRPVSLEGEQSAAGGGAALIGLIAFPLLNPTWVFVK